MGLSFVLEFRWNENLEEMPDKIQLIVLLLAIFCFAKIEAQYCGQYAKCGECMSDPSCQWCSDVDYEG